PPGTAHGPGESLGPGAARTSGGGSGWHGGSARAASEAADGTAAGPRDDLGVCLGVKGPAAVGRLIMMLAGRGLTPQPALQLTSFHWESVLRVHRALPRLVAGFLTPRFDRAEIERVRSAGLAQICPRADLLTPELVETAHGRGLNVRAWGVATREHFAQVIA